MSIENADTVWHKNTGEQPEETMNKLVFLKFRGDKVAKYSSSADPLDWELLGSFSDIFEWRLA